MLEGKWREIKRHKKEDGKKAQMSFHSYLLNTHKSSSWTYFSHCCVSSQPLATSQILFSTLSSAPQLLSSVEYLKYQSRWISNKCLELKRRVESGEKCIIRNDTVMRWVATRLVCDLSVNQFRERAYDWNSVMPFERQWINTSWNFHVVSLLNLTSSISLTENELPAYSNFKLWTNWIGV